MSSQLEWDRLYLSHPSVSWSKQDPPLPLCTTNNRESIADLAERTIRLKSQSWEYMGKNKLGEEEILWGQG